MNTLHHISNQAELEQLINRYFDGDTSIHEEQELRQCLADCPWSSELIDEARFTIGYFVTHGKEQRATKKSHRRQIIGIAASIAIVMGIGGTIFWQQNHVDNMCIAYVNGQTINDDDAVMAIVKKDMNNMAGASQIMIDQLSSLGEAIELDNI